MHFDPEKQFPHLLEFYYIISLVLAAIDWVHMRSLHSQSLGWFSS